MSEQTEKKELIPEEKMPEVLPATERKKKRSRERAPLTCRTGAKVTAFLLTIVLVFMAVGAAFGAFVMWEAEIYTRPEGELRREIFQNIAEEDICTIVDLLLEYEDGKERAREYVQYKNIAHAELSIQDEQTGLPRGWGYDNGDHQEGETFSSVWYRHEHNGEIIVTGWRVGGSAVLLETITAELTVAQHPVQPDEYRLADQVISLVYAVRYWIYVVGAAALIGAILCFVFLMYASGRRVGQEKAQPGWGTWVPVDVLTLGTVLAVGATVGLAEEASYFYAAWKRVAAYSTAGVLIAVLILGWCMSVALRFKLGGWWKNSLVWLALKLCWKVLRGIGRGIRALWRETAELVRSIPLVWKTVLAFAGISMVELLFMLMNLWEGDNLFFFWVAEKCILFPVIVFLALVMRRLQKGGAALAEGDLSYQVDTGRMFWDLKKHGEHLNRISEGMTVAVEQRMRSERMKTELITNVSHDIKTPLTSIINYADLIGKNPARMRRSPSTPGCSTASPSG